MASCQSSIASSFIPFEGCLSIQLPAETYGLYLPGKFPDDFFEMNWFPWINSQKTAVFGDIHSNIEALDAVLADMKSRNVTRFLCTGDVVGYGANPSACIQRLKEIGALTVRGNHDVYCTRQITDNINTTAQLSAVWTGNQLTPADYLWLCELPSQQQQNNISITHSTFKPGAGWIYILEEDQATESFPVQPTPLAFYGHTHRPVIFVQSRNGTVQKRRFGKIHIKNDCRYFINPGSVGQPRDGDPRAAYALYDPSGQTVTLRRVEYDIENAAEKILEAGLPAHNAERLRAGR